MLKFGFWCQLAFAVLVPSQPRQFNIDIYQVDQKSDTRVQELCESQGGHPGHPIPNTVIVCMVCVDVKKQ